jgi:hypothetical protein
MAISADRLHKWLMRCNKQLLPQNWILILYDAIMYFGDFDIFNIFLIIDTELQLNDQNQIYFLLNS